MKNIRETLNMYPKYVTSLVLVGLLLAVSTGIAWGVAYALGDHDLVHNIKPWTFGGGILLMAGSLLGSMKVSHNNQPGQ